MTMIFILSPVKLSKINPCLFDAGYAYRDAAASNQETITSKNNNESGGKKNLIKAPPKNKIKNTRLLFFHSWIPRREHLNDNEGGVKKMTRVLFLHLRGDSITRTPSHFFNYHHWVS